MKQRILQLLRQSERPLGAYEIIAKLSDEKRKVAPPTVYRALSVLIEDGSAHRVESKNAYVACQCDAHEGRNPREAVFSICDECGVVAEHIDAEIMGSLDAITQRLGFSPSRHVIEIHGRCAVCVGESTQ